MFEDGKWAKWKGAGTGFVGRRRVRHGKRAGLFPIVCINIYFDKDTVYNIKAAIVQ